MIKMTTFYQRGDSTQIRGKQNRNHGSKHFIFRHKKMKKTYYKNRKGQIIEKELIFVRNWLKGMDFTCRKCER